MKGRVVTSLAVGLSELYWRRDFVPPLHALPEIFDGIPKQASLALLHLCLWGYNIKLDVVTLSHIRNLTSLDVSHMTGLETPMEGIQFWHTLQTTSIHLEELVVEEITEPLVQYLESYIGLECLNACVTTRSNSKVLMDVDLRRRMIKEARSLSNRLWCTALPRHKASLYLYMGENTAVTRAPSCMTEKDREALAACKNL